MTMVAAGAALVSACTDTMEPGSINLEPPTPSVTAINTRTVRVQWQHDAGSQVKAYILERRANLTGQFAARAEVTPGQAGLITFVDTDVEPGTFYGYRVRSVARLGGQSKPSRIAGARTPPAPGILLRVTVQATDPVFADLDGFTATLTGPTGKQVPITAGVATLLGPLEPGNYTLALTDVSTGCVVSGGATRALTVVDSGLGTVIELDMSVVCTDPTRGAIVVNVVTIGDTLQATPYTLKVVGTPGGQPFSATEPISPAGPPLGYTSSNPSLLSLLPGTYEVSLIDLNGSICEVNGQPIRNVTVSPLSTDTVRYTVSCSRGDIDTGAPITLRQEWEHASATPGQHVRLYLRYDGRQRPEIEIGGTQLDVLFDPTLVRIDSATAGPGLRMFAQNTSIPGRISVALGCDGANGMRDTATIVRMSFTVLGQVGSAPRTTTPRNNFVGLSNCSGDVVVPRDSVRIIEGTLPITGTQQPNQLPIVDANGPYSGNAGSAISFNGTASDPDGSIVSWAWAFGDGASSTAQNPTHAYASAGSYIARLTVTDNAAATATDSAFVTVAQPPQLPDQFAWRNEFSAASVQPGDRFTLRTFLKPPLPLYIAQGDIVFDSTVIRLDSIRGDPFWTSGGIFTANKLNGGRARMSGFRLDTAPANDPAHAVPFVTLYFTAIGASGTSAATMTMGAALGSQGGAEVPLGSLPIIEDTISIGAAQPTNQAPIVQINGPYSGTVNTATLFTAAGTVDPDGDTMFYQWEFGDGAATGLLSNLVTHHIYLQAGTFDVRLNVFDSRGASSTRTTTAVIAQP